MVSKKESKTFNRNGLLLIFITLGLIVFVFAASTTNNPATNTNYSHSLKFNCSTAAPHAVNASLLYNASGGAATVYLMTIANTTAGQTSFENGSISITSLVDATTYNMTCLVSDINGTNEYSTAVYNITIDNTAPVVNFTGITNTINNGNYSGTIVLNVSVSDVTRGIDSVYFNITNSSGKQINFTKASNPSGAYYNISLNTVGFTDGKFNITVWANDTFTVNGSGDTLTNLNNSERIQITIDNTPPSSVTLTRGTGTTTTQNVITITAVDATSGINNCVVSGSNTAITGTGTGTQTLTHTGLNCGTSYSYIVTCYDYVGNSRASISTSFSTSSCGGGGSSGGSTTTTAIEKINVFPEINPGEWVEISNFEEEVGLEKIVITINEKVSNMKFTVKKFDSQPEEIAVSKEGNVHKYLQIETQNLGDKLEKAIVTIKVQKNWLLDNGIDKANIALYKFDESAGEWKELLTVYKSEDDNYYYYDTEVTSFSYFAISEKVIEELEPELEPEPERNLLWLWIVIGAVVVAAVIGGGVAAKKRR